MDINYFEKKLYVSWNIHVSCNYRCPYCFFYGRWAESGAHNRYLSVAEWMKCWNKIYERYNSVHIDISGGEPFIYPSFLELLFELQNKHILVVNTNLSWNVEPFVHKISPERVRIEPTFHPLFAEYGYFLEKVLFLKNNKFEVSVNCLGYPPMLKNIPALKRQFESEGIVFSIKPFRGIYNGFEYPQRYTLEEKNFILGLSYSIETENQLKRGTTKGKLCSAGQRYVKIRQDGSITRCGNSDTIIGNIIDTDIKLLDNPLPCESVFCNCESEAVYLINANNNTS